MMTMATPLSAVRSILEVSCLSWVRALCCMGFRLQWFVHWYWDCLSNLLTSDVSSSASWAGSLEEACSMAVMYASMGFIWV